MNTFGIPDDVKIPANLIGGFAIGAVSGAIGGSPILPLGIVTAISCVTSAVFIKVLNEQDDLTIYSMLLISAASDAVFAIATLVACVALGIIDPTDTFTVPVIMGLYGLSISQKLSAAFKLEDDAKNLTMGQLKAYQNL